MMRRVFVIGEQRSGTTLLLELLAAQPGCFGTIGLLSSMLNRACNMRVLPDEPLGERRRHILLRDVRLAWRHVVPDAELSLTTASFATVDELHRLTLAHASPDDTAVAAHKEHTPVDYLPRLLDRTDIRVVFIARDPRAVMLSRWYRGDEQLDEYIWRWRHTTGLLHKHRHQPQLLIVRYEDLITQPDRTVARLSNHLDHPVAWANWSPRIHNSSFSSQLDGRDSAPVDRWKEHAHEKVVRFTGYACRRELALLDYPAPDRLSRTEWRELSRRLAAQRALTAAAAIKAAAMRRLTPAYR